MTTDDTPSTIALEIDAGTANDPTVRAAMQRLTEALADADLLDDAEVAGFSAVAGFKLGGLPTPPGRPGGSGGPIRPEPKQLICFGHSLTTNDDGDLVGTCGLFF